MNSIADTQDRTIPSIATTDTPELGEIRVTKTMGIAGAALNSKDFQSSERRLRIPSNALLPRRKDVTNLPTANTTIIIAERETVAVGSTTRVKKTVITANANKSGVPKVAVNFLDFG